jgi:hypothetical protein
MHDDEPPSQEPPSQEPPTQDRTASERSATAGERTAIEARAGDRDRTRGSAPPYAEDAADEADKTDMSAVGDDGQVFGG